MVRHATTVCEIAMANTDIDTPTVRRAMMGRARIAGAIATMAPVLEVRARVIVHVPMARPEMTARAANAADRVLAQAVRHRETAPMHRTHQDRRQKAPRMPKSRQMPFDLSR
jgi:hypothetical protein